MGESDMKTWQAVDKMGKLVPKFYKKPSELRLKQIKQLFRQVNEDAGVLDVTKARMQDTIERMENRLNASDDS
jgi:hypothetical protein